MSIACLPDQSPGHTAIGRFTSFDAFAGHYAPKIGAALSRLGNIKDQAILDRLTIAVLTLCWCWRNKLHSYGTGVFISRILLSVLFQEWRRQNDQASIARLQQILLIHPDHYSAPLFL